MAFQYIGDKSGKPVEPVRIDAVSLVFRKNATDYVCSAAIKPGVGEYADKFPLQGVKSEVGHGV
jgi:hypothetical protein